MEFLKEVLGDELYSQVAEKLNGNESIKIANIADGQYIPKAKFDAERTASKTLKGQIDDLNSKIAQMQDEAVGVDAIKAQLAQLQSDIAKKDAEMKSQRMDYSILDAARKHKAKDPDLMAKMIDRAKIAETENGYSGLDEQFETLAKTYGYMFDNAPAPAGGFDPNRIPNGSGTSENSVMNGMIRSAANFR